MCISTADLCFSTITGSGTAGVASRGAQAHPTGDRIADVNFIIINCLNIVEYVKYSIVSKVGVYQ